MSHPAESEHTRRGRGLRAALVLSLALNLLLVGVLAGGALRFWRAPPQPAAALEMRALWHALPDETRASLRAEFRPAGRHGDEAAGGRADRRRSHAATLAPLLRTDPFDAAGFAAALDGLRGTRADQAARAQAALVTRIAALPAAERAAIAERMETRQQRRPWGERSR